MNIPPTADSSSPTTLWRVLPRDQDPTETQEWLDALDAVLEAEGPGRASYLLRRLLDHARERRIPLPPVLNTPYLNTIPLAKQPQFPGNLDLEQRINALVRWNALAMVVKANRAHGELGGHIASYASAADLYEVGFNHFFRAGRTGDLVYFQPHSAPGVYARAFLEGRLEATTLDHYRRETAGDGLSSYCHPYLMPDFWQFPTGSMGLGPLTAIYQARFMRYLEHRGILTTAGRKVWAFPGDGEMDEPESLAGLSLAAREGLDNLIFVVNCNLQRLDGPVRGNGSIVQELEGLFAGAGWNVVKLLWGSDWDPLFARDSQQLILRRLHETVDGELQRYAATDGIFNREHFFSASPELSALVAELSDEDIDRLRRGGHDPVKIHAAFHAAVVHRGQPTVILAQTKKGYGMGQWGQGRMTTHQQKKLDEAALLAFRDRFSIPVTDEQATTLQYCRPPADSPEIRYLHQRRESLGGYLPMRRGDAPTLALPPPELTAKFQEGSHDRTQSTTGIFVAWLTLWLRDSGIGPRLVPIVADEARTFGMQSLFRQVAIYSSTGQLYDPEDREELLYYREARDGQILEEGITEAGAISSWIAAATSYSTHGVPMLPFYIFYSCFGFQRVGDLVWSAGDSRARGFLLGATAGRTTLSGEGLQHQDGASHLFFSTVPNCVAYDPCFGHELVTILEEGARRMLVAQEDVFYYVTLMNENYAHPAPPPEAREGILRGMYRLHAAPRVPGRARATLLGSGTVLREALAAAVLLAEAWAVDTEVWSVTSYTELRRDGLACARAQRLQAGAPTPRSWVAQCLDDGDGPVVAATDYVSALPDLIRAWVPRRYVTLGTDGYGRSDTRAALRCFFEIDRHHLVLATLAALADAGTLPASVVEAARSTYGIHADTSPPWAR
jgi:pyruvate dehydrogenase E1 component